jgi:plasmid maintenance system killer protein
MRVLQPAKAWIIPRELHAGLLNSDIPRRVVADRRIDHDSHSIAVQVEHERRSHIPELTYLKVSIRNIVHKGLKRLYAEDNTRGVPPDTVDKLRKMLAFLDDMEGPEELRALRAWEGAYADGRQQRNLESQHHSQPAPNI